MALRRKKSSDTSRHTGPAGKGPGLLTTLTDPKTVFRAVTVIRVAGPLLAAGTMKASTTVRGALDERRARQLGVPLETVAEYRGPGGPALARVTGLTTAVRQLQARRGGDPSVVKFCDAANGRLAELRAAVDATASMPSGNRRSALRAIGADLDQLDAELMTFLVGPPTT